MSKVDMAFIGGRGLFSNYGGVENAIREIALEVSKKNENIIVYGASNEDENVFPLPRNLTRVVCPLWIYQKLGQHGLIVFCVLHALFVGRPKVVYLFASGPCIFTPLLRLGRLKVITSLRAVDSARDKWGKVSQKILQMGEYCSWRFANAFTVNSKEMVEIYAPRRNDVKFIPNGAKGIETKGEGRLSEYGLTSDRYLLFAARLDPVKRLHILLEAHSKLPAETRPMLVVAGGHVKDKLYEQQLIDMASPDVVFVGHISKLELDPLMAHCRAFILPSVLEGMSNSILSAMAAGKPVLAADVPANSDLVEYRDALFTADDCDELQTKLSVLSSNDEFCATLGAKLKERAKAEYSWSTTSEKFYQLSKSIN
ncbi:MAG: glycosyltransferase family 4 protein [Paraglaciecola polaris]|uniref:glycosyltransferase family 4 protein n=1 Tax=Paraglaciecola polaris TaxID=222814 RepID=UPI0030022ED3